MTDQLAGRRIACLVANEGVEQVELTDPKQALERAGATVEIVAPEAGDVQAFHHLDAGDTFAVDRTVSEASIDDYDGLLLPGGVANPDALRTDSDAIGLVDAFFAAGKPVAAICHAPWTIVEADRARGRVLTSWPSLQTDIRNAGGEWVDRKVVVCDHQPSLLVTSRKPDDLPQFIDEMVQAFARGARDVASIGASPAAGVLDPGRADPPEPSEPG